MRDTYNSFNFFIKTRFNDQKIRKIPLNAGLPCPNKTGEISFEGCIFCDPYGSGPIQCFDKPIEEQVKSFIGNHTEFKYFAYFQANTNTHAPINVLREKYETIFKYKEIIGLFIGTRPDSIAEEAYPLLEEFNKKVYLCIELGLQSIHEKSLVFLHRNHTYAQFLETFEKLKSRSIDTVVHLILGLPGETREDMFETIKEMNRIKPAGIKFHVLHILKDTPLFNLYEKEPFKLLEKEEYIELVITLLENLDPSIVVHRLSGERDAQLYHAPAWAQDKNRVIQAIRARMRERHTYQGKALENKTNPASSNLFLQRMEEKMSEKLKLKNGEIAPGFCLPDANESNVCLSDLKGKWVVLYFYPKDSTPGCTIEAVDFSGAKSDFEAKNTVILGISADPPKTHRGFISKKELTVTLLSDIEHTVLESYGVWQLKKNYGREFYGTIRTTYLVNPEGKIAAGWPEVKVKGHVGEVMAKLKELQG